MAAASTAACSACTSARMTWPPSPRQTLGDAQAEALCRTGDERHLARETPRGTAEGGGATPVGLHLPVLDEASLVVAQRPYAPERIGRFVDAQAIKVDVASGIDLLPGVAGGEDAETRHDGDDGRHAMLGDVGVQRRLQQGRDVVDGDIGGWVEEQREAARVDDLVGRHGAALDGVDAIGSTRGSRPRRGPDRRSPPSGGHPAPTAARAARGR